MNVNVVEKFGDVKIFGNGLLGGKGDGLVKINECKIPRAHKLRTRVLTTVFYDRFLNQGKTFKKAEIETIVSILDELGDIPISVRSSATNEACFLPGGGSVHAGENTSFMLPNNHPDPAVRLNQLIQAIYYIYDDFIRQQPAGSVEKMAIVLNPIPGNLYHTYAGPVYYPLVSGVANSFFPYALKTQNPDEGFARIALGHGYAVVLDDFPVVSMATIRNPLPLKLLGNGQMYFYALDMTKNEGLQGNELETMKKLHIRFADIQSTKLLGQHKNWVTFERLIQDEEFGFKHDLLEIMEIISTKISSHYQIEFVFNLDAGKPGVKNGRFHVVQLTQLPELKFETIQIPGHAAHTYLSINNLQGHGIKPGIKFAVVVSPFIYTKSMHDSVRKNISLINRRMHERDEEYMIILPGRIGSNNKDWGIWIDYRDIDKTAAIFEYGVDIAGRIEPLPEEENVTGGIYGSHFLYMIQGGYDEDHKRIQTRMYGTQGTHFLTNLVSNNIIFGYIAPGRDRIDPWFFTPAANDDAINVLQFPREATIYADSKNQHCVVI